MQNRRQFMLFSAFALSGLSITRDAYSGQTILKLNGPVSGADRSFMLDLAAIDTMPKTSFVTSTPWHKGVTEFSGVTLRDCLAVLKLSGTKLQLIALNDYVVEASLSELEAADALLATRQNGDIMPVSDKGPIFLIFPFDSRPELQHQSYYSRAVWQLAEINIL